MPYTIEDLGTSPTEGWPRMDVPENPGTCPEFAALRLKMQQCQFTFHRAALLGLNARTQDLRDFYAEVAKRIREQGRAVATKQRIHHGYCTTCQAEQDPESEIFYGVWPTKPENNDV